MSENRDVLLAAASELRSLDADNKMLIQTAEALTEQRNEARARVQELEALNAELLDTLKKVAQRHFCGCGAEGCRQCTEDCMVLDLIEKAGGAAF